MNEEKFLDQTSEPVSDFLEKDEFWLYDLRVEVVQGDKPLICNHEVGAYFVVEGENLVFKEGQNFPMYSIWAVLPFLPAKQRNTDGNDWMTTDSEIACPDPYCGGLFRITRIGRRKFRLSETTGLPLLRSTPYWDGASGG